MVGQRDLPFEPRHQIRIFKPGALHTIPWYWARAAAWLNEAVRSHRTDMTKKLRGFRPPKFPTCTFRPSHCITKDKARLWWMNNKCLFACVPLQHPPGQQTRNDTPNSLTDHGPSTTLPTTPETVKKSKGILDTGAQACCVQIHLSITFS